MTGENENLQIATFAVPLHEWQGLVGMVKELGEQIATLKQEDKKELLTSGEVCKLLNISRSTLQRYINSGDIVPERIGNKARSKLYIRRSDIERIEAERPY